MNTFGLDKRYDQFYFSEITIDDLKIISGGSGGVHSYGSRSNAALYATGGGCDTLGHFNAITGALSFFTAPVAPVSLFFGTMSLTGTAAHYMECS